MIRSYLDWARNAFLPAAVLLAFAAPASAQTLSAIYVMKIGGSEIRKASHCDDRWLGSPAWAHDGKRLLYDAAPANRNYREGRIMLETLAPADKKGGDAKEGKDSRPVDLGYGLAPAWSADDKQVAFHLGQGNAAGERPGVYVMNVDGQGREWICEGQRPRWSPDGEKLLVASQHEGFASLYIYDIFEAKLSRVLEQGYDQVIGGCWSPDGKRILGWISSGGQERLHLFDPAAVERPALLAGPTKPHNSDAVFSPDRKQIAWASWEGD